MDFTGIFQGLSMNYATGKQTASFELNEDAREAFQDLKGCEKLTIQIKKYRKKRKKGERELAAILKSYGYEDSRRGQQYCGSNGDADVVGLPGIHIECKRVEKLNIYDAVEQSKNDARTGEMPVVMHRKNRKEWLVTMPLDDWMELYER